MFADELPGFPDKDNESYLTSRRRFGAVARSKGRRADQKSADEPDVGNAPSDGEIEKEDPLVNDSPLIEAVPTNSLHSKLPSRTFRA